MSEYSSALEANTFTMCTLCAYHVLRSLCIPGDQSPPSQIGGRCPLNSASFPPNPHSQAIDNKTQEDEDVVALEVFHVAHKSLAQLPKVSRLSKAPLIQKIGPGPDGGAALLQPLLSRALRQESRDVDPGRGWNRRGTQSENAFKMSYPSWGFSKCELQPFPGSSSH